jgi:acetyl-CoA acetyltransferase
MMAEKYGLSKDDLDHYAYQSHQRAIAATQGGSFKDEIIPLQITRADGSTDIHAIDEGIRFDASLEGIKGVKLIAENGKLTAASASQICDGASGVMVVNEKGLKSLGIQPMARIHHMTMIGGDPVIMLEAPLPATERALKKAGMSIDDIDLFENHRRRPGAAQRQWRRHRARPSPGRLRHQADDHAGQRAQAAQQALRPADHVRRRRHGQCDDRGKTVRGEWRVANGK